MFSFLTKRWRERGFQEGYLKGHEQGHIQGCRAARDHVEQERLISERIELEMHLNKPVISIGNEWTDPVIGFGVRVELVTKARCPKLVVHDYITGEDVYVAGAIRPYTDQIYRAIKRLDPYERWELVSRNGCGYEDFDKPHSGIASSPEELDDKLTSAGFFVDLAKFRMRWNRAHTSDELQCEPRC